MKQDCGLSATTIMTQALLRSVTLRLSGIRLWPEPNQQTRDLNMMKWPNQANNQHTHK